MKTVQSTVISQLRNRARSSPLVLSVVLDHRIDRVDKPDEHEPISKAWVVPTSLSVNEIRSKVKSDLFKSAIVAFIAMIVATRLQFVSLESAGFYLLGIAFTSYLSLHSLDHYGQAKPSSKRKMPD